MLEARITPNTAPIAVADSYSVHHADILQVSSPGVLANDTDADQDPLTAVLYTDVTNGMLYLNADGSFDYYPYSLGADTFEYQAFDGTDYSDPVSVTISVTNTPPISAPDVYDVVPDQSISVTAPGVLANDTDADQDTLSAELVSGPVNGYLDFYGDGSFEYYPDTSFVGNDFFTYRSYDGAQYSDPVTVTLVVSTSTQTVTWDGGGDGVDWHDPYNWDTDTVPFSTDDVVIPYTGTTIVHASGTTTLRSLTSDADLDFTGSLTLNTPSTITGVFDLTGTLDLQAGTPLDLFGGGSFAGLITLAAGAELWLLDGTVDVAADSVFQGAGQVRVTAGAVFNTAAGGSDVEAMTLQTGGLAQGAGVLRIGRQLTWTGGTMQGPGSTLIQNNATVTLSGSETKTLKQRTLSIEPGATGLLTGGVLTLRDGAVVANQNVFEMQGDNLAIEWVNDVPGATNTFINSGTFRRTLAGEIDQAPVYVEFSNSGTVVVDSGELFFRGNYTQDQAGAVLDIQAGGTVRVEQTMDISAGTIQGGGWLWVGDNGPPADLRVQYIHISGQSTIEIDAFSQMHILGDIKLDQRRILNYGTIDWTAGTVTLTNAVQIDNMPDASFLVQGDLSFVDVLQTSVINNHGVFRKTVGAGTSTVPTTLNNQSQPGADPAEVQVNAGRLVLGGAGTHSGSFLASAMGSIIELNGPAQNHTLNSGTLFDGPGETFVHTSVQLTIPQGVTVESFGTFRVGQFHAFNLDFTTFTGEGEFENQGTMIWVAAKLVELNTFRNTGLLLIGDPVAGVPSNVTDLNSSTLINEGTIRWIGPNILMKNQSNPQVKARIENRGLFDIRTDYKIERVLDHPGAEFINATNGSVTKTVGSSTTIEVQFANYNNVSLMGRELVFTEVFAQHQGTIALGDGRLIVPDLTLMDGTLNLGSSSLGMLTTTGGLTINAPAQVVGLGSISGNVTNHGNINLGLAGANQGALAIVGNYTQTATGRLTLRLPQQAGLANDRLQVYGTATLGGELNVLNPGGLNLAVNDEFTFLEYYDREGDFASYVLPPLNAALNWQTVFDVDKMSLKVI